MSPRKTYKKSRKNIQRNKTRRNKTQKSNTPKTFRERKQTTPSVKHKSKRKQTHKQTHKQQGGKWSEKYKKSIDCNNPKGFSQRQHCKYGRKTVKKHN